MKRVTLPGWVALALLGAFAARAPEAFAQKLLIHAGHDSSVVVSSEEEAYYAALKAANPDLNSGSFPYVAGMELSSSYPFLKDTPLDGVTVHIHDPLAFKIEHWKIYQKRVSARLMGSRRFSFEELQFALPKLALLQSTNARHNFLPISVGYLEGDDRTSFSWFAPDAPDTPDTINERWSTILNNFEVYARLAAAAGMNLQFDPEGYAPGGIGIFSPSFLSPVELAAHPMEELKSQVKLRGRQVMQAIQAGAPGVDVLFYFAHSILAGCAGWPGGCDQTRYALLPAFIDGMLIANANAARPSLFFDGFENAYYFGSPTQYHPVRKVFDDVADADPPLTSVQPLYKALMKLGFGFFLNLFDPNREDEELRFQAQVTAALRESDKYVWLYTENNLTFLPKEELPTPTVTPPFLAALERAKAEANAPLHSDAAQVRLVGSEKMPRFLRVGQKFKVRFMIRNTGGSTWSAANGYRLGTQSPRDNNAWGVSRISLDPAESVEPGQSIEVSCELTAPKRRGVYSFSWQMLREYVGWFGNKARTWPIFVR